eukprot:2279350-Amphidinium_carterae.1
MPLCATAMSGVYPSPCLQGLLHMESSSSHKMPTCHLCHLCLRSFAPMATSTSKPQHPHTQKNGMHLQICTIFRQQQILQHTSAWEVQQCTAAHQPGLR